MKAITTKFHGPTNRRYSRYSASTCDGNRIMVECDDELTSEQNHDRAARMLCKKMKWGGKLIGGGLGNKGNVYVFLPHDVMLAHRGRSSVDVIDLDAEVGA